MVINTVDELQNHSFLQKKKRFRFFFQFKALQIKIDYECCRCRSKTTYSLIQGIFWGSRGVLWDSSSESERIKSLSPLLCKQNMEGPLMSLTLGLAKAPALFGSPLSQPHMRMNVVFVWFSHLPEGHLDRFARRFSCTQPREGFSFSAVMWLTGDISAAA